MFYVIYTLDRNGDLKYIASKINAKFIKNTKVNWNEIKKDDIVISNEEGITGKAKVRGITAIHLMENGHFDKDSKERYDFSFYYIRRFRKSAISGIKIVGLYKEKKAKAKVRRGVANVILNKKHNKVLLLKRKKPGWGYSFVQGGIEKGETELQALERETYEESGVSKFVLLKKVPIKSAYYLTKFNGLNAMDIRIGKYNLFITETEDKNKITFNDASAKEMFISGGWFSISDAYKLLTLSRHKKYLDYVVDILNIKYR